MFRVKLIDGRTVHVAADDVHGALRVAADEYGVSAVTADRLDATDAACLAADKAVAPLTEQINTTLAGNPHGAAQYACGRYYWPTLDALYARRRVEWHRVAMEHGADPARIGSAHGPQ